LYLCYDNSTEGYDLAKLNSKSPLDTISVEDPEGKEF
jgi:hypothetical protein